MIDSSLSNVNNIWVHQALAIILFSLQPERFYSAPRKTRWLISFYNDRATYKKNSYCSGLGKYTFKNLINFQLFDVCMAETSLSGMRPGYHSANIVCKHIYIGYGSATSFTNIQICFLQLVYQVCAFLHPNPCTPYQWAKPHLHLQLSMPLLHAHHHRVRKGSPL